MLFSFQKWILKRIFIYFLDLYATSHSHQPPHITTYISVSRPKFYQELAKYQNSVSETSEIIKVYRAIKVGLLRK